MKYYLFKRGSIFTIFLLLLGGSITPSISGSILESNTSVNNIIDWKSDNIDSCKTPDNLNDLLVTKNTLYVRTDEFGLREYTYLNPDSCYDYNDNFKSLNFRKIERPQRIITNLHIKNNNKKHAFPN